jgi:hypothetical protein
MFAHATADGRPTVRVKGFTHLLVFPDNQPSF